MGYKNHSIRGDRYRYSRYSDGTEELYDHVADPMEHDNLINRPDLKSVINRLSAYIPNHDEPEIMDNDFDKKRFRRTMAVINKMGPEYRKQADRGELDPDFVKEVYKKTK